MQALSPRYWPYLSKYLVSVVDPFPIIAPIFRIVPKSITSDLILLSFCLLDIVPCSLILKVVVSTIAILLHNFQTDLVISFRVLLFSFDSLRIMNAFAAANPPIIIVWTWAIFPKVVGLNVFVFALFMSSQVVKLRFIKHMANARSCVSSGFPPTASHERLMNAGVRSRQFSFMNCRGSLISWSAGSSSKIL